MVKILSRGLIRLIKYLFPAVVQEIRRLEQRSNVDKGTQVLLSLRFKEMMHMGIPMPSFDEVGFRAYSENDEDGILLYIFTIIGVTNKHVVDIGAAGIQGSNTANLIINHGWVGLLIDGNEQAVKASQEFYASCRDTKNFPPTIVQAWVTAENINSLISEHGFIGEIDLLSIDIDGMDYWVWKAIECINPRAVVVEYLDIIGPNKALVVPYRPDFRRSDYDVNSRYPNYVGASLPAFVKLASKGGVPASWLQ